MIGCKERYQRNQDVWAQFQSLGRTLPAEDRDYADWHKGRTEYAVWTIIVQSPAVQTRFDAARAHLAGHLMEPYLRQPHVTLFVCGFLAKTERHGDDYPIAELERCRHAFKEAKPAPFEIKIGGINSFAAAPFLEIFDPSSSIAGIRKVLSSERSEIGDGPYLPHLTLGMYADRFETRVVAEKIVAFEQVAPITYCVDQIGLATYAADKLAGRLTVKDVLPMDAQ